MAITSFLLSFYQRGGRYVLHNWKLCVFLAFLAFVTIYLRAFALDYPSIGFHNEKENEWLAVTKDYYLNGFSTCKQILHHEGIRDLPCFENPQLAFISIVGALSWHLFGESISAVRVQMILYALLSIFLAFGIASRITCDRVFAACVALVYTLLPLMIFFGRTINEAAPANFFMMLSFYLFLLWKDNRYEWKYSIAAGASLALAGMIKLPYVLPIVALLGVFPYADFYANFRRRWFLLAGFLSFVALLVGFLFFLQKTNLYHDWRGPIGTWDIVHPFRFLRPDYWVRDNIFLHKDVFFSSYGSAFLWSALIGFLWCLATKNKIRGFVFFYFVGILLSYSLFGHFLVSQSYYSLPFTFGLAIAAAFLFYQPFRLLVKKFPNAKPILYVSLLLPFLAYAQINRSVVAQFNTQFLGGDVIGTLIKEDRQHIKERIFYYRPTAQTKSLCYYAFMTCVDIARIPPDELRAFGEKHHIQYLYVNNIPGLDLDALRKTEQWSYIEANYAVKQIGFRKTNRNRLVIIYVLLKKGAPYKTPQITSDRLEKEGDYYWMLNIWTRKKRSLPFYVINY